MSVVDLSRARLAQAIEQAESDWSAQPIVWGVHDCALGAADVLKSVLGYDPAEQFRDRYTTPRGYLRVLRRDGFNSLDDALRAMAARHRWPVIDPNEAAPGDVGVAEQPVPVTGRDGAVTLKPARACLLYKAAGFWVGPKDFGFGAKPSDEIELAFKVI